MDDGERPARYCPALLIPISSQFVPKSCRFAGPVRPPPSFWPVPEEAFHNDHGGHVDCRARAMQTEKLERVEEAGWERVLWLLGIDRTPCRQADAFRADVSSVYGG